MSSTGEVEALEEELKEGGNKLLQPPSSVDELLRLLDVVQSSLFKVEQSPGKSTHTALSSLMKALVTDELLRHPDSDVKVAVASCISEITRITAPDAPYEDDEMKDVFGLIVSSLENLSDQSSRSYVKRVLILETMARLRSCVMMLDLECDELITDMFRSFLRNIRDYHPEEIFSAMEAIMGIVLDESEDISSELLSTLLSSLKKDNEEVSTSAGRKLGEKVFKNCSLKLTPCVRQATKSLAISLHDYSEIVTSLCEGTLSNGTGEQLGTGDVLAGATQEDNDLNVNRSPRSTMSNDIVETKKEESPVKEESLGCEAPLDPHGTTIDEETTKAGSDNFDAETNKKEASVKEGSPRKTHHLDTEKITSDATKVGFDDSEVETKKEEAPGKDGCPENGQHLDHTVTTSVNKVINKSGSDDSDTETKKEEASVKEGSPRKVQHLDTEKTTSDAINVGFDDSEAESKKEEAPGKDECPEKGLHLDHLVTTSINEVKNKYGSETQKEESGREKGYPGKEQHVDAEKKTIFEVIRKAGSDESRAETEKEGTSTKEGCLSKGHLDSKETTNDEVTTKAGSDHSAAEKSAVAGMEHDPSTNSPESLEPSCVDDEKKPVKPSDKTENDDKHYDSPASEDTCTREAKSLENEKDIHDSEAHGDADVASLAQSEEIAEESPSVKGKCLKENDSLIQEYIPPPEVTEKISEKTSDAEAKLEQFTQEKAVSQTPKKEKASSEVGISEHADGATDSDVKPQKKLTTNKEKASSEVGVSEHADGPSDSGAKPQKKPTTNKEKASSEVGISEQADDASDSDAKPQKKPTPNKGKASSEVGISEQGDGSSDSDAKPQKKPRTKSDASLIKGGDSSIKKKGNTKKRKRGSAWTKKQGIKSYSKDDIKESSQNSFTEPGTKECHEDETPSKKKRTLPKENASETMEYDENLVGLSVKVWWPKDRMFYEGVIGSFDPIKKKHKVLYDDGETENLNLKRQRWEIIERDSSPVEEAEAEHASTDAFSETRRKNAKKSVDSSAEEVLPRRGSSASSSKLKGTSSKSGKKSKDSGKVGPKSRDDILISDDETSSNSKAYSQKIRSRSANDSKSKTKQDAAKSGSKSKEITPKTGIKSKGKSPQIGTNTSDVRKARSSLTRGKEEDDEDLEEDPDALAKALQATKRKLSAKKGSDSKRGKKRQRR